MSGDPSAKHDYIEDNLQAEITAAELAEQAAGPRDLCHPAGYAQNRCRFALRLRHLFGLYKPFCREFGSTSAAFLASGRVKRPWRKVYSAVFSVDIGLCRCYIEFIKCLQEQTGKELKSMIVREVATG